MKQLQTMVFTQKAKYGWAFFKLEMIIDQQWIGTMSVN